MITPSSTSDIRDGVDSRNAGVQTFEGDHRVTAVESWSIMRSHLRLLAALLLTTTIVGCRSTHQAPHAPDHPSSTEALSPDDKLLEAGLRYVLADAPQSVPLFISLTPVGNDVIDPPRGLLAKLADLNLDLKPASAGTYGQWGIFDRATRKRGYLYWASIKERLSETQVRLDVGHWYGPLAAGGEEVVFELRDGKWVPVSHGITWVS